MEKQTQEENKSLPINIRSISEKWVGIWQRGENPNLYQCVDEAIKEALKPSIKEEGTEFIEYCKNERDSFSGFILSHVYHPELRTAIDSFLICFDQLLDRYKEPQRLQDEGLNIAYEQYIELLILELHETVPLAARLGWESTKFAKGEKLRHKINQLKLK